jgi:serine protease Do
MRYLLAIGILSIGALGFSNQFNKTHFISSAYAATNPSDGFADLVERLSPAVVNISTTSRVAISPMDNFFGEGIPPEFNQLLQNFLGGRLPHPKREQSQEVKSLGSGFVIDPEGYIVTNHHVVKNAEKIEINFPDGSNYKAKIIGSDAKTDLALVKIINPNKKFTYVDWGNSTQSRVGEWVVAIGNPYGLSGSVSAGIISALNRNINAGPYDNFIQTDAAINRGNSGGPLFNMSGEVIGVNSAIISPSGGSVGVGFAIPADLAKNIIGQIKEKGSVERGRLGIYFQPLTKDIADALHLPKEYQSKGALIGNVEISGPAAKAGLQSGDVIIKVNDTVIDNTTDLPRIVAALPINQNAKITFYRNGTLKTVDVKIIKESEASDVATTDTPTGGKIIKDIGITISDLNANLRSIYRIPDMIQGVIIEDNNLSKMQEFQKGDIILEINQNAVNDVKSFVDNFAKARQNKNDPVLFKLYRGGNLFYFAVRMK